MEAARWFGYGMVALLAILLGVRSFSPDPTNAERRELTARIAILESTDPPPEDPRLGETISALRETVAELLAALDRREATPNSKPEATEPNVAETAPPAADPPDRPRYGTPEWQAEMDRIAREGREVQADWLADKLGLDSNDRDTLLSIIELEHGRSRSIHQRVKSLELPVRALATELERIRDDRDEALLRFLTEDQLETYKKLLPDPEIPKERDE